MTCVVLSRSIGGIPVDVMVDEKMISTMEIAEHPVERGAKVSDHAWRKPHAIMLTGVVRSENALGAYEALLALQARAEPFDFMTPLKLFESMLIESLDVTRDREKGRILYFEAELREVIIVSTQSEASSGGNDGNERGANNPGEKNGKNAAPDKAKTTVNRGQIQPQRTSEDQLAGGLRAN